MADDCCCAGPRDLTHTTPAYRRALWIVVILNAGYGVVEIVGGYLAGSQALKADALDFLGDWQYHASRTACVDVGHDMARPRRNATGRVSGASGVGVLAATVYRAFYAVAPEAGLMSAFGIVALVVNVAAALVLMKHREGDANVRAVWLFSRNDAIGNAAVVVAAAVVWLTGSHWADVVVAAGIAALFMQSALEILRNARADLARTAVTPHLG